MPWFPQHHIVTLLTFILSYIIQNRFFERIKSLHALNYDVRTEISGYINYLWGKKHPLCWVEMCHRGEAVYDSCQQHSLTPVDWLVLCPYLVCCRLSSSFTDEFFIWSDLCWARLCNTDSVTRKHIKSTCALLHAVRHSTAQPVGVMELLQMD